MNTEIIAAFVRTFEAHVDLLQYRSRLDRWRDRYFLHWDDCAVCQEQGAVWCEIAMKIRGERPQ